MDDPVLVEVLRGGAGGKPPPWRGRGRSTPAGASSLALGDVERPVSPRSAVKALQALPLVESGAADRLRA